MMTVVIKRDDKWNKIKLLNWDKDSVQLKYEKDKQNKIVLIN